MTPTFSTADLAQALLPALSNADLLDVIASSVNEMNRRGDEIEFKPTGLMSQWAEIEADKDGKYRAVFHDYSIAVQASEPVGSAA